MATGIRRRHSAKCPAKEGGRCNCKAGFEAWVYSARDGKKIRKTFPTAGAAKSWRSEASSAVERGALKATKPVTLGEAWIAWYEGAGAGTIRNRSGGAYKPSALRGYEKSMRLYVLPRFERARLADITLPDLQDFVESMIGKGFAASTIQVMLLPVRAIYKRAIRRGELAVNPCVGLEMPAITGRRERFADAAEAEALIAALPIGDRALWSTAFFAGLRRGELMALKWDDIDLAAGVIDVRRGYDPADGEIDLKSKAGRRRVPLTPALRQELLDHKLRTGRSSGYVFGTTGTSPFDPTKASNRADAAWKKAALNRLTLHEARHSYASLMIAAGVNAKALSTFMGHANISVTLDRYGHLMPGSEAEAAAMLVSYLDAQRERAEDAARGAAAPA